MIKNIKFQEKKTIIAIVLLLTFICLIIFIVFFRMNMKPYITDKDIQLLNQNPMPKKVHLWIITDEDSSWTDKFEFMYKPITMSIYNLIQYHYRDIHIEYKYFGLNQFNDAYYDEIEPNDILIKVGWATQLPYELLKSKKIYTIYFNTEAVTLGFASDELWTYSRLLFNDYGKGHDGQIIKFVPIICEENIPTVPYNLSNYDMKLVFLGKMDGYYFRDGKKGIILNNTYLKDKYVEIYDLWDDITFNNFMKSEPKIFLNIPKDNRNALPSVRINKLLSYKSIIISEHTNDFDEELYKDIVYFCKIDEIEGVFRSLREKTGYELQTIANERYNLFYNRFCCKNAIKLVQQK